MTELFMNATWQVLMNIYTKTRIRADIIGSPYDVISRTRVS